MANESCFVTAGLASSLHGTLPSFTELGRQGTTFNVAQFSSGEIGFLLDYYLKSVSWGLLLVLASTVLLLVALLHAYCVYRTCCCRQSSQQEELKPKRTSLKWGCGCISILLALFCLPMLGVGFWAEIKLSEAVLQQVHQETSDSQASVYVDIETKRHWIIMAHFVLITCATLGTLVAIVIAAACNRLPPLIIMVVLLFVISLLTSLIVGAGFSFVIVIADLCVNLATSATSNFCTEQSAESWTQFCGTAYMFGFIVFVIGCGLILNLMLLLMAATTYSGTLYSGVRLNRVGVESQPSAPPPRAATQHTIVADSERRFFVGGTSAISAFPPTHTAQPRYSIPSIPLSPLMSAQEPGQDRLSVADAPPRYEEVQQQQHPTSASEEHQPSESSLPTATTTSESPNEETTL